MNLKRQYPNDISRHDSGQKYYTSYTYRTGHFEQLDLFVQNVPFCVFESNTISKKLLRASPLLNAGDSWELKAFSALMFCQIWKSNLIVPETSLWMWSFPLLWESSSLLPESLYNTLKRHCTGGVEMHIDCTDCTQSKINGFFSSPIISCD